MVVTKKDIGKSIKFRVLLWTGYRTAIRKLLDISNDGKYAYVTFDCCNPFYVRQHEILEVI